MDGNQEEVCIGKTVLIYSTKEIGIYVCIVEKTHDFWINRIVSEV